MHAIPPASEMWSIFLYNVVITSSQTTGSTSLLIPLAPICTRAILEEAKAVTSSPGIIFRFDFPVDS